MKLTILKAGLLSLAVVATGGASQAQEYPDRAIMAIVPFQAGSSTDTIARVIVEGLADQLGQPVVVENKPGGNANIGITEFVNADADGYTIMISGSAATVNPALFADLQWSPEQIQPVALLGISPYFFYTRKDTGITTLQQLVDKLKAEPNSLRASSGGVGNAYLQMEGVKDVTGVEFEIIPYAANAEGALALASGEVDFTLMSTSAMQGFVESGDVVVLAAASETRSDAYPDAPTVAEAGFPELLYGATQGVYVPADTPAEIITRLNEAVNAVLADATVADQLAKLGYQLTPMSSEDYSAAVADEIARFKAVAASVELPQIGAH